MKLTRAIVSLINSLHLFVALVLSMLFSLTSFGQVSYQVEGRAIDSISLSPIPYATVAIADKNSGTIINASVTDEAGKFSLQVQSTDIRIDVSFIGFEKKSTSPIQLKDNTVQVGDIKLARSEQSLGQVTIQAERSTTEFKLDRRVFNVGKDLSSTGASALEVLNNVPSVNVNIEGDVTLRGSGGVQILINGKPSVIASEGGNALGTITADMIEKVEVITNPSAKYDAEGTSGIINIILKKEDRKGINGSISLNGGWPHNHSVGVSLNRRTEKFNLFTQIGGGYRSLPRYRENINTSLIDSTTVYSKGVEYRNEEFYNFILGTDYHLNKYNVITLSGSFALELEDQPSETDFRYTDTTGEVSAEWLRTETTTATNPKYQFELQYKRDFKNHKDHDLLFSALGNYFGKDLTSDFLNETKRGDNRDGEQITRTNFKEAKYTFKLDYTRPIKKLFTLETGAQYVLQDVSNDYSVSDLVGDDFVVNSGLTNVFDYVQNVLGVYTTGAYEKDKWGLKLGIRAENTDLRTLLVTTGEANNRNFTNLFPSLHTSCKFNKKMSVQGGYSRRIYRPRLWDLNPFFNIRNNFSIRTGNPDLMPEFTDSYELSGIYQLDKASLNASAYYRVTHDMIERISRFSNNITTFTPENVGTNQIVGVEFNGKYRPKKRFTIFGDLNLNYFQRDGEFDDQNFDFSGGRWSGKATMKYEFIYSIDAELTGRYESGFVTVQGNRAPQGSVNIGLRKKLMKGKTIISANVRDLFITRIGVNEAFQPSFYSYSRSFRGRFFTLGVSYGFGKGEAMQYSGRRR